MKKTTRTTSERGFTFIELILALALLATSMSVFIGLQAAAVQRTIRDRNMQQAMLAARKIMAALDTNPTILEQGSIPPTPLPSLLSQFGFPPPLDQYEQEAAATLQASLNVETWPLPIPGGEDSPLRKLILAVAWGTDPAEKFELVYYLPIDDANAPPV